MIEGSICLFFAFLLCLKGLDCFDAVYKDNFIKENNSMSTETFLYVYQTKCTVYLLLMAQKMLPKTSHNTEFCGIA